MRIAVGFFDAIVSARLPPWVIRSSGGQTDSRPPRRWTSDAGTRSAVYSIRPALDGPTIHWANEAAPRTPTSISVSANVAVSEANAISLTATSASPPPPAAPLTAQMTGTAQWRTAQNASRASLNGSPTSTVGGCDRSTWRSLMSRPPQNTRSPAPVRITAEMSSRWRKPSKTTFSSRYVRRASALAGGRSITTSATRPFTDVLSPGVPGSSVELAMGVLVIDYLRAGHDAAGPSATIGNNRAPNDAVYPPTVIRNANVCQRLC